MSDQETIEQLQKDKSFLLENTEGLKAMNQDLQADLKAAEEAVAKHHQTLGDAIGLALFGVRSASSIITDYLRILNILQRTGVVPPDCKEGAASQYLVAQELKAMKDNGQVTNVPVGDVLLAVDDSNVTVGEAPVSSSIAMDTLPPAAVMKTLESLKSDVLSLNRQDNAAPSIKQIQPPAGGWINPSPQK